MSKTRRGGLKRALDSDVTPREDSDPGSPEIVTLEDMPLLADEKAFFECTGIVLPKLARVREPRFAW